MDSFFFSVPIRAVLADQSGSGVEVVEQGSILKLPRPFQIVYPATSGNARSD
jgi:hypothetical protein